MAVTQQDLVSANNAISLGGIGDAFGDLWDALTTGIGQTPDQQAGFKGISPGQVVRKFDDLAARDKKMKVSELWVAAGGPESEKEIAAAVARAESSCNNKAANWCCHCLMQINVKAHPQYDAKRLKEDPMYCMQAAVEIWRREGWEAWQVYTQKTYRKYLGQDCEVTVDERSLVGDAVDYLAAPLEAIARLIGTLLDPSAWFRVGKVVLGGVLFVIAVYLILKG